MFISIFSPVTGFHVSVAQVCFPGAIGKLLWQGILEQFVKLMEVFSFNYSQKDLKISMYSKYFLNVSHHIINFKCQKQHQSLEIPNAVSENESYKMQMTSAVMWYSDHREITAILQGGRGISHFSSKYYTNTDEGIFW